jgi:type II secretory pathway component PulF
MPLIVTPRQLVQRAQLYHQLGQLMAAGVTIMAAMEMLARNPPARSYREPIKQVVQLLAKGSTVSEAWPQLGKWVPTFDIALIRAAEESGRLDSVFKMLANYYNHRATLAKRMISDLLYPVFLFHFSTFLFPFITWFGGSMSLAGFALRTFGVLIPIYAVVWALFFAAQAQRGSKWRALFEKLLRPIPVLGTARHELALSRLCAALEALISAGVNIIQAWEMAAEACGSPGIYKAVLAWKPEVLAGKFPSEAVNAASSQFPELFANLYHSGEVSGELDESLIRLRDYYQEEGTQKLHLVAQWVPRFIYFCVAGLIAYKIIAFYTGYFKELNDIMK